MSLFSFIFNTLRIRVNDPKNHRFWLPKVLEGISGSNQQGKLLPLTVDRWEVGTISGEAGTTIVNSFLSNYRSYLEKARKIKLTGQDTIANPATPYPRLSFLRMTINGLENLRVMGNPPVQSGGGGYETVVTLQTNYYNGKNGTPTLPLFGLSGDYLITQDLCTADHASPGVCNGRNSDRINGQGKVALTIANAFIKATVRISIVGAGKDRKPLVTIGKLVFLGEYEQTAPGFSIDSLSIVANVSEYLKDIWLTMSQKALNSPEGQAGIFGQVNSALNEPGNLRQLSETLSPQLSTALDSIMGAVPSGRLPDDSGQQLPNPADLYVFDRLRYALNDPQGQWFLPRTISSITQPPLEPLRIDRIDLPDQQSDGLRYTQIRLTNGVVTGLSHLQASSRQLVFDANGSLDATLTAVGLRCTGSFSLLPEGFDDALTGGYTLDIDKGMVHFRAGFSGEEVGGLNITIGAARLVADPSQIRFSLQINSEFRVFINAVLNTPGVLTSMLDRLNDAIGRNLDSVGREISKATNKGIASRLDE